MDLSIPYYENPDGSRVSFKSVQERDEYANEMARIVEAVQERAELEVRVVDPHTGGEKGTKPERWDLMPWPELQQLARMYARGAEKYTERNWEQGYPVSLSYAALMRHLVAWWGGEDNDSETDLNHLTSVIFHALAMMRFTGESAPATHLDDRP